jgi:hypothetical protein
MANKNLLFPLLPFLIFYTLSPLPLQAQEASEPPTLIFTHLSSDDGLPHLSGRDIVQNAQGFIVIDFSDELVLGYDQTVVHLNFQLSICVMGIVYHTLNRSVGNPNDVSIWKIE